MELQAVLLEVTAFLLGAIIGSFLNMVIWRLPRRGRVGVLQALSQPSRSYCPNCKHSLSVLENIPLVSFLALRARCRSCKQPIPWRYFWVELASGSLFLALFVRFGASIDVVAYWLFFAALVAALFIDLDLFIIPDELNTFALFVGVGRDVLGIAQHDPNHALVAGWLPRSILGAVVCAAIFVFIQLLGYALFRKEAMGDGDVKLARAIGAMMPLSQALVSFLLAIAAGAVIGGGLMAYHALATRGGAPDATAEEELEDEGPLAFEPGALSDIAARGACYVLFLDLLIGLAARLRVPAAVRMMGGLAEDGADEEEDDFVAGPTHIPFGPYMVVGAVLAVFAGDPLVQMYLHWAGLR